MKVTLQAFFQPIQIRKHSQGWEGFPVFFSCETKNLQLNRNGKFEAFAKKTPDNVLLEWNNRKLQKVLFYFPQKWDAWNQRNKCTVKWAVDRLAVAATRWQPEWRRWRRQRRAAGGWGQPHATHQHTFAKILASFEYEAFHLRWL